MTRIFTASSVPPTPTPVESDPRMSNIPKDLRYTAEHEYVKPTADAGVVQIGITDNAQGELGDVVFVELPKPGAAFDKMQVFGTIEAVKAVSELYCPVAGTVVEANGAVQARVIFAERADEFDIVLLDMTMPDGTGAQTCRDLRAIRPTIPVVFSSGFDEREAMGIGADTRTSFLPKPYSPARCATAILTLLDQVRPDGDAGATGASDR